MSRALIVHRAGPALTLQDAGRPGWITYGLSRGGAMDRLALAEGEALLGRRGAVALEMGGMGGQFEATEEMRIALTGAPMRATLDGAPLLWHASHLLPKGARLEIGPATSGAYGYLHVGGGFAEPEILHAQSAHLTANLGAPVAAGTRLAVAPDRGGETGRKLAAENRFAGGTLRVVESLQTAFFPPEQRARFGREGFTRDNRANRMGVKVVPDGAGYGVEGGLSVVSEVISPGDIQITGDGAPFVLLAECQTTGGYPRLGTVIPADLPRIAQAPAGARLSFRFVSLPEALAAEAAYRRQIAELPRKVVPVVRDPADVPDLLSHKLVSGFSSGDHHDH
ncbi:biotin-dependent carboxyltransferase family protein [Salipiger sp. P9]|uniref:5-oxoprolinase subunit C family protein n=1 Tax=Salipiger pentaromativorans TaxID=2943193 RepID=UPI00215757A7|nr:biotin-dependent carboxyltransferase family protein [Salipiger pentaromativorans]MCR8549829.1 biotin-dependent carboxyltransferase family protein [Salipiger pentaromativorans]